MLTAGPFELLHLVGFVTGAVLYGMLLVMAARPPARPDVFALATGVLGLTWNLGELAAYGVRMAGFAGGTSWIHAVSFTALGFLASVVVHSVARLPAGIERTRYPVDGIIAVVVYTAAAVAGGAHLFAAASQQPLPSPVGLTAVTVGLVAVIPPLVLQTRQQMDRARTMWMAALAVVAVSALHLGRFHGGQESWPVEIVGHHASIILVFAILYQDYRFALADIFLKKALALLMLVVLVFGGYSAIQPVLTTEAGRLSPVAVGVLLAAWAATALLYPLVRRAVGWFVDRIVLGRADYGGLVSRLADDVQHGESPDAVLDRAGRILADALTAAAVVWEPRTLDGPAALGPREVAVWTTEAPQFVLQIGVLAGGRRLLSDDVAMLERAAVVLARRIDALRLTSERYERMLQEREMRTLATEAELRALRAQINPHFLFNTLTTIGYLIQHAPPRALRTLLGLTTLLRSALRSEGELTTLGRELELVDCYLKIERERFEERLEFEIDVPEPLLHCAVPALIVQPLVENAVKHGIAVAREGGAITITARREGVLRIAVRNTGAPLGTPSPSGFAVGLENVRKRLHHHYGPDARLTLGRDGGGATVAELSLPADDAEGAASAVLARRVAP